jgi:Ca-activated chloride channel family protein
VDPRRRRHAAVRFTNAALLAEVAPARPGWRRHLPAAAVGLALAALVVAVAEPVHAVRVPKEAATIMVLIDVSASMDATDVAPTRLHAAIAAGKAFVNRLPPQIRVGLISFSMTARVIASPTVDHQAVVEGIERLVLGTGTATGDAIYAALTPWRRPTTPPGRP